MNLGRRALLEPRCFVPEAQGQTGTGTAGAAGALLGAVLGDRREGQETTPLVVTGAPHQARVDHHADPGNGERGLRDVGRQDHLAAMSRTERPGLLLETETAV